MLDTTLLPQVWKKDGEVVNRSFDLASYLKGDSVSGIVVTPGDGITATATMTAPILLLMQIGGGAGVVDLEVTTVQGQTFFINIVVNLIA